MSREPLSGIPELLRSLGYTTNLFKQIGVNTPSGLMYDHITSVAYAYSGVLPRHIAVRMFYCGATVSEEIVRKFIKDDEVKQMMEGGLVRKGRGGYLSVYQIIPYDSGYFANDFNLRSTDEGGQYKSVLEHSSVMRPNYESYLLSLVGRNSRAQNILDIGTGSGFVCLSLLKKTKRRMIGIDPNPRAIVLSNINKELNKRARNSYLFEESSIEQWNPQGRMFDLILSNPPHSFWPRSTQASDGGATGQAIAGKIIKRAEELLTHGGKLIITTALLGELKHSPFPELLYGLKGSYSLYFYNYSRTPLARYCAQVGLKTLNRKEVSIFTTTISVYNKLSPLCSSGNINSYFVVLKPTKHKKEIVLIETAPQELEWLIMSNKL